jgi:signal transduction histidine kinase
MASGVAHEISTPLNVISGRASIIAGSAISRRDVHKHAAVIVQQSERIAAILKNLLAFSRRAGSNRALVDLNKLVEETVTLLAPLAMATHLELRSTFEGGCTACVNATELQQVLTNLIMNAVQAMPKGGTVHVSVERSSGKRPLNGSKSDRSFTQVRVRDEGTGIPPEVMPHIFDPFFTTKDVGSGSGLGLWVTYSIVKDHGGWIDVHTALGEGTEFVVHLAEFCDVSPDSGRTPEPPSRPSWY